METLKIYENGQWSLVKSDIELKKGRGKFDPTKEYGTQAGEDRKKWTTNKDNQGNDVSNEEAAAAKQRIPRMEGTVRERALSKLTSSTKHRRNPDTNEIEFLMHRGMGHEELTDHHNKQAGQIKTHPDARTSWTTQPKLAHRMAYYEDTPGPVVSAWVPESSIVSSMKQYGGPTDYDKKITHNEDEWIIHHQKPIQHHEVVASQNPRKMKGSF